MYYDSFHFVYLGCKLFKGRKKTSYFQFIVNKFITKVIGWKKKLLSQRGRLILIKHILSSIPVHVFAAIELSKRILRQLERIMYDFFSGKPKLVAGDIGVDGRNYACQ